MSTVHQTPATVNGTVTGTITVVPDTDQAAVATPAAPLPSDGAVADYRAEDAALLAANPAAVALAHKLYPTPIPEFTGTPELAVEFYAFTVQAVVAYQAAEHRDPRCAAELDAWSDSTDDYAAYLAANPVLAAQDNPALAAALDATPVVEAKAAAEAAAAVEVETLLHEADLLAKQAVRAIRRGEKEYRLGLLEAGKCCHQVVLKWVAARNSRKSAVQYLEGQLARAMGSVVDVNELIRCSNAWQLLAEAQGMEKDASGVTYGSLRSGWSRLIQAVDMGKATERYTLLPGKEDVCRQLFVDGVRGGWDLDSTKTETAGVLSQWAAEADLAARQEKAAAEVASQAAAAAKNTASVDRLRAEQANYQALQAERDAKAAGDAVLAQEATDKALAAHEALVATQQAEMAAQHQADKLAREVAAAKEKAAAAEKVAQREAEKNAKAAAKAAAKANGTGATITVTPLQAAKPVAPANPAADMLEQAKGTSAKDMGEYCHRLLTLCKAPEEALFVLLNTIAAGKACRWPADITAAAAAMAAIVGSDPVDAAPAAVTATPPATVAAA